MQAAMSMSGHPRAGRAGCGDVVVNRRGAFVGVYGVDRDLCMDQPTRMTKTVIASGKAGA
jgi:hypothetical protein